ncbi:GTPase domain-containing protein [Chondromyces crocatus]|uniref:G domain-containing protein n=1 Tax=Chondromyces crocatus TaxID=52 RepID=A0A0K1EPU5_CHOCO|nr:GTPase domain-containing protein [Chondromyces crocatus]AKT42950.1 uncharacterized protein CMC5_071780 [Chondromyces crocatus]
MSFFSIETSSVVILAIAVIGAVLTLHKVRQRRVHDVHVDEAGKLRAEMSLVRRELQLRNADCDRIARHYARLQVELKEKEECLLNLDSDILWHREQLATRLTRVRRTYRVLTMGVKYTGKTSLTLKWANPLVDLGTLKGTKTDRYERTVSITPSDERLVEHVFEIHDWGGEHIVDAQQEMILEEIHGVLLVVDLTGKDGKAADPIRIQAQLRAFQPEALRFFFGPKMLSTCKTVVLFINKSDVLSGTSAEVEKTAMDHYRPLIEALEHYRPQIDLRVFVGSASYGHSTHHLFAHFVERILPRSGYDPQLLQRMKADPDPPRAGTVRPVGMRLTGPGTHGGYVLQTPPGASTLNGRPRMVVSDA